MAIKLRCYDAFWLRCSYVFQITNLEYYTTINQGNTENDDVTDETTGLYPVRAAAFQVTDLLSLVELCRKRTCLKLTCTRVLQPDGPDKHLWVPQEPEVSERPGPGPDLNQMETCWCSISLQCSWSKPTFLHSAVKPGRTRCRPHGTATLSHG